MMTGRACRVMITTGMGSDSSGLTRRQTEGVEVGMLGSIVPDGFGLVRIAQRVLQM